MSSCISLIERINEAIPVVFILLHGGPGMDHSYFSSVMPYLSEYGTVVTYHQGSTGARTIDELVMEFREAVLSRYPNKKIVLVGHSWGATLGLEIVRQAGADAFSKVILVAPVYGKDWVEDLMRREGDLIEKVDAEVRASLEKDNIPVTSDEYYRRLSLALTPLYFSEFYQNEGRAVLSAVRYDQSMLDQLQAGYLNNVDLRPVVQCLGPKCRVMVGERDRITHPEYVKQAILENGLSEMEGVGHFPFVENPEAFSRLVRSLLGSQ